MTIQIIERPAQTLVGLEIRTTPMAPEIPALWPRFVARIDEIQNAAEPRVSYGVMRNVRGAMHSFDYAAAISVTSTETVPKGMTTLSIPAGTYAAFSYPLSKLGQGFAEIFDRLLPRSGYVQVPGPYFERYDEKFDPHDPGSAVGIYLPVTPGAR